MAALTFQPTHFDRSVTNLVIPVSTTSIDRKEQLIGFQGDLAFDERVISFQDDPIQKAGLTGGNWNVTGNVLDGPGPIRILRVSAFSSDQEPLSGAGTLFELKVKPKKNGARSTSLIWATPPNNFLFIDANLNVQRPAVSASSSITSSK